MVEIFECIRKNINRYKNFKPLDRNIDLRFLVISDIHIAKDKIVEKNRIKYILKTMYRLDPNINAIVIVGDLTDSGEEDQYREVAEILKKYKKEETLLVTSMGNHEGNTKERFVSIIEKNPRDDKVINGYHFITLSPRWSDETYGDNRYYLDEQWLKERLDNAINEDNKRPIFVFMHHGIKNTVYGTEQWNTEDLGSLFIKYENVIHFSGHSHYPLNSPRSIYQKDFTAVNTSTTSYFELENEYFYGSIPPESNKACQAMIVEVKDEFVTIKKLDLINNSYILENWVVDTSKGRSGFKYLDNREGKSNKPYFQDESDMIVEKIRNDGCIIKLKQALIYGMEDSVHSYEFSFKNLKTYEVEKVYKISSQFYILPMPKFLRENFNGLSSNTEYEVEVKAFNCYGKESTNSLKKKFITKKTM